MISVTLEVARAISATQARDTAAITDQLRLFAVIRAYINSLGTAALIVVST